MQLSEAESNPAGAEAGVKRTAEDSDKISSGADNTQHPNKKIKLKGRNKQRPVTFKANDSQKVCPAVLAEQECRFGEKCKFCHDVATFMKDKPEDIGPECYNFKTFGRCPYGLACRFAQQHIDSGFKNITDQELFDKMAAQPPVKNTLTKDLQHLLWKKKYDFSKANKIVDGYYDELRKRQNGEETKSSSAGEKVPSSSSETAHPVDCDVDEENVRLRPAEKKIVSSKQLSV